MSDHMEDLGRRLVVGHKSDGRSVYDEKAKAELVAECAKPGVSVSRLAREAGVNANQLSRWVREQGGRRPRAIAAAQLPAQTAFVPMPIETSATVASMPAMSMHARMGANSFRFHSPEPDTRDRPLVAGTVNSQ